MLPDWSQPWLQPYRAHGEAVAERLQQGEALHQALSACAGPGQPRFVHATQQCPVRENLHDFFNGLVWLHFPKAKARLNALHAAELARPAAGPSRGPLRDALTVFDENGALLLAPRPMWDALRARDWRSLFVTRRGAWNEARLLLFGHGLLEKLQAPRKPITAHVVPAPQALDSIAKIDHWLADAVGGADWRTKPFAPLPVLGVPGWCAGNAHESFYDDPLVFRRAGRSDIPEHRTLPGAA